MNISRQHRHNLLALFARYDLWQVVRYGLVGFCAAATHASVAFLLFWIGRVDPTLSNFGGFASGAVISYLGSYYFTFKRTDGHQRSLPRYALVWLIGITINLGLFKTLLGRFGVPFEINVGLAIILTPIVQYLMLRFWAFRK